KIKQINKFSPENKSAKYIKLISETHRKICRKMSQAMAEEYNVLILSGDHSNSAGFIAGMRETYPDKKIGLIWIDAHGDIHSPYTSPSGNMHGMPVAIMLAYDNIENQTKKLKPEVIKNWERIKRTGKQRITPKLQPEDITYIAIRDLEKQEWDTLEKLNIKHYPPRSIREKTVEGIIKEMRDFYKDYDVIYISFDVDS
ncbi:MAG: arginase, partial [Sphingobacteriales bacterium]